MYGASRGISSQRPRCLHSSAHLWALWRRLGHCMMLLRHLKVPVAAGTTVTERSPAGNQIDQDQTRTECERGTVISNILAQQAGNQGCTSLSTDPDTKPKSSLHAASRAARCSLQSVCCGCWVVTRCGARGGCTPQLCHVKGSYGLHVHDLMSPAEEEHGSVGSTGHDTRTANMHTSQVAGAGPLKRQRGGKHCTQAARRRNTCGGPQAATLQAATHRSHALTRASHRASTSPRGLRRRTARGRPPRGRTAPAPPAPCPVCRGAGGPPHPLHATTQLGWRQVAAPDSSHASACDRQGRQLHASATHACMRVACRAPPPRCPLHTQSAGRPCRRWRALPAASGAMPAEQRIRAPANIGQPRPSGSAQRAGLHSLRALERHGKTALSGGRMRSIGSGSSRACTYQHAHARA